MRAFDCFQFGSSLSTVPRPHDVDVLLVYSPGNLREAHLAAEALRMPAHAHEFDVLVLSRAEERQTNFVLAQRPVKISL